LWIFRKRWISYLQVLAEFVNLLFLADHVVTDLTLSNLQFECGRKAVNLVNLGDEANSTNAEFQLKFVDEANSANSECLVDFHMAIVEYSKVAQLELIETRLLAGSDYDILQIQGGSNREFLQDSQVQVRQIPVAGEK
jgi:hypothetical protein